MNKELKNKIEYNLQSIHHTAIETIDLIADITSRRKNEQLQNVADMLYDVYSKLETILY